MSELILNANSYPFQEGAYSIVELNCDTGRATKLFKNSHDISHTNDVFNSEVAAYKTASENPELAELIPKFFGVVSVSNVLTKNSKFDINNFHPELAYQMSLEKGSFMKIGSLHNGEGERIKKLFRASGINHMNDASVLVDENIKILKVIDFAMQEYELWA